MRRNLREEILVALAAFFVIAALAGFSHRFVPPPCCGLDIRR